MANKTPVSRLQELCTSKGHSAPIYDEIESGNTISKTFKCEVAAFGAIGIGEGKSKKDAKHAAAVDLLEQLKLIDEFAESLREVPAVPLTVAVPGDAVSTLLDKCVLNDWPLAQFNELQGYGVPHAPEFMIECRLASLIRIGKFKTKKGAKQIAAQQILDAVANVDNLANLQVATIGTEEAQKRIRTYRELKNSDIKDHSGILLSNRHMYFAKFDNCKKEIAREVLYDIMETPREKIELLCNGLGLKYELGPLNHSSALLVFQLLGNFDCVLSGPEPEIFDDVLNYFKMQLNNPNDSNECQCKALNAPLPIKNIHNKATCVFANEIEMETENIAFDEYKSQTTALEQIKKQKQAEHIFY